jgi:hypothetical protein
MAIPTVPDKVQAGDLITSDFMNKLIDVCVDLQGRVSKLETPTITPTGTQINALLPSGDKHIGDTLYIIGQGFDAPQGTIVTIDSIGVTPTFGADKDHELIVTIPNVQGVTAAGKTVTLLVSNTKGTDMQDFVVFPAVATIPQGQLFVNLSQKPSDPQLLPSQSYVFVYTVQALTDLDETYVVSATMSTGWAVQVVNDAGNPLSLAEISLPSAPAPAGATQTVRVRVTIPAGTVTGTTGTLRVTVTSKRNPTGLVGRSGGEILTVGAAPPSPLPIAITLNNVVRTNAAQPSAVTGTDGRVRIGAGPNYYRFGFGASIKANTVYTVQITPPSDPRWTASFSNTAAETSRNIGPVSSDTSQPIFVFLRADAGAPDTTLTLRVTSTTDATQTGQMNQPIGLLP